MAATTNPGVLFRVLTEVWISTIAGVLFLQGNFRTFRLVATAAVAVTSDFQILDDDPTDDLSSVSAIGVLGV